MRNFDYLALAKRGWDNDILNLVAKIHECKGRQELFVRQKPAELDRMVVMANIQSSEASNKIEGIVTTSARLKQLFAKKASPRNRDESEIMGYRDALNTIHDSHEFIPIKVSYILQLHRDLLKRAGLSYGGQLKSVQNYINETLADGTSFTRFMPVVPHETQEALAAICASYEKAMASESIVPLILIPAFICDFLCIHPFNDGNGRMSRLLTLLLLYKSGYNVGKYISIEKQIEKTKERYYDVLESANAGWHEERNDPIPFIRYMLQVTLSSYTEFEDRVGLISTGGVKSTSYDVVRRYVQGKIGKFTGADVIENCPSVGRSSILSALTKLVAQGVLVRQGKGRSTYYVRAKSREKPFSST